MAFRFDACGWVGIMGPSIATVTVREPVMCETRNACRGGAVGRDGGRDGAGVALAVARGGEGAMLNNGRAESQ